MIKAIIFDLGGVVLEVDYYKTINAFRALGHTDFEGQYSQMKQSGLFDQLETGKIEPADFVGALKEQVPHASDQQILNAWNAIICDFPAGRLDYMLQMKEERPSFLLSNTNAIHLEFFNRMLLEQTGKPSIDAFFHKAYLSHEINLRKPDAAPFQLILEEQGQEASSTLFIDDSPQHIETAKELGLQTLHLTNIHDLEKELATLLA